MCGVAGLINIPGSAIADMLFTLEKRGPDHKDFVEHGNVTIGHTRLSIIDKSHRGNQPMWSHRYILSFNGEIYNYMDLLFDLDPHDDLGSSLNVNDAAALLGYIEKYGIEKAINSANGMFAFALYDKIERKVHLIVDRLGQKPMYYYHEGKNFAFASSPAALKQLKKSWPLSYEAIQSYFLLGSVVGEQSIYADIKKVTASQWITFNEQTGVLTKTRWWRPEFKENTNGIEDLVLDSIRKVKISDVPVSIFLSGGIDSTLVASQCQNLDAIHLDGPERDYAQQVANKFGNTLRIISPQDYDMKDVVRDYVTKSGEPSMAGHIPWIVSKEVSKFTKVAISANGADELFFGYNRTGQDISITQRDHMFRECLFDCPEFPYYDTDIDDRLSAGRWYELTNYVQFDLNKTLDFASMCHSLEVRSPFLDHRLVEMALSIPERNHKGRYGSKNILKEMLAKMGFDRHFLTRPKQGFSLFFSPKNYEKDKKTALKWCIDNEFLIIPQKNVKPRDQQYLESSAYSFKVFIESIS